MSTAAETLARKIHERYCEHQYGVDCEAPVKVLAGALDEARLAAIREVREWAEQTRALYATDINNLDQVQMLDVVLAKLDEMERG